MSIISKPILYMNPLSPPARSSILTATALGIRLDTRLINILKGDQLSTDFVKLNPQHTIPTLVDNGIIVYDSSVINGYLVDKYAHNDVLYPKDLVKRGLVNARLHFNTGALFSRIRALLDGVVFEHETIEASGRIKYIQKSYEVLEAFLQCGPFVCGDDMTIADFACVSSLSSVEMIATVDVELYPEITKWINRMKMLPYYEAANGEGARGFGDYVAEKLRRNYIKYKK